MGKKVESPRNAKAGRFGPSLESSVEVEKVFKEKKTIQFGNEIQIVPVTKTVETVITVSREIYVADKTALLDPHLGKTVKIIGQMATVQAEGQTLEKSGRPALNPFKGN